MIESFGNTQNNSPEDKKEAPEDKGGSPEVSEPEFDEKNIDRARLKSAIEIALDGNTATERFREGKAIHPKDGDKSDLRAEVLHAEQRGSESDVLKLEQLIREQEEAGVVEEPKAISEEERSDAEKQILSYSERLTALANEKDPLGLARVALRETYDTLGTSESTYMKAGPFEELAAADKLGVVRDLEAFKEKTRTNREISESDYAVHLKGLIYSRIAEQPRVEEGAGKQIVGDESTEASEVTDTEEEPEEVETDESREESPKEESSGEARDQSVAEKEEEEQRVEDSAPSSAPESSDELEEFLPTELSELKDSAVFENVIQTLRESVHEALNESDKYKDPAMMGRAMNTFNERAEDVFAEDSKGIAARRFIVESIKAFLSHSTLSESEQSPYKKVLEILSADKTLESVSDAK